MREVLSTFNHQPIEFYGKVVDQFGQPIPGVNVKGSVLYNNGLKAGVEERRTTSDANGLFSFTGMAGRTFDYHLEKPGYVTTPEGDAFDYTHLVREEDRHYPDASRPVIVKMWKLQGPEPLIHARKTFRIPSDGNPVYIDLETGKTSPAGGDIVIKLSHPRQAPDSPMEKFDWSTEISAIDGGFIEANQRVRNMLLAPENGYQPINVNMRADRQDWDRNYRRNAYLKSRGRFARLTLEVQTDPKEQWSSLILNHWLNPAGSRNLESAPTKEIAPSGG